MILTCKQEYNDSKMLQENISKTHLKIANYFLNLIKKLCPLKQRYKETILQVKIMTFSKCNDTTDEVTVADYDKNV